MFFRTSADMKRVPVLFFALLLILQGLLLSGCGDNEPEQRAAFINALEKNVLSRPGIRIAQLTEEQKKNMGAKYVEQFAMLNALDEDIELSKAFDAPQEVAKTLAQGNSDPTRAKKALEDTKSALAGVIPVIKGALEKYTAKRDSLSQPEDLKNQYTKAFNKCVITPLESVSEMLDGCMETLDAGLALNEYILANPGSASYKGNMVQIESQEHQGAIEGLFNDYREKGQKLMKTVNKIQSMLR